MATVEEMVAVVEEEVEEEAAQSSTRSRRVSDLASESGVPGGAARVRARDAISRARASVRPGFYVRDRLFLLPVSGYRDR